MDDIFLLAVLIAFFAAGYFIVKKIDTFLCENRSTLGSNRDAPSPSHILLDSELSDEEAGSQLLRFRQEHRGSDIFISSREK